MSYYARILKRHLSAYKLARLGRGQHNPSLVTLQKIAKALSVPVTERLE